MTKEQKDKILKAIAEDRNDYARERDRQIAEEQGKIIGADYMLQRFLDVLNTEVEMDCRNCKEFEDCPCGKDGHESGTSQGYSIGECEPQERSDKE